MNVLANQVGKEICRVGTADFEGELAKGRGREIAKDLDGSRSYHLVIIGGFGSCIFITHSDAMQCILPTTSDMFPRLFRLCLQALGLLVLIDPLGDKADFKLVNVPDSRGFFGMITQSILIIMMNPIYS
jgi:hypothetical protein